MKYSYPPDLPISAWRGRIVAAVRSAPVTVVCGDTGSGKTTQLPKMLLEAGFGEGGMIACTQPRRLPAVEMARRVAAELGEEPGATVGFQHRFARNVSGQTRIKFMTDGVLLSEMRTDRMLKAYGAIIIDEAHERSLNIDMLLGFLKRILARRRDLKVVISSATLDVGLFSEYFGGAPVVSVPGKRFPVEVRYRPPEGDGEADLSEEVCAAVDSLPPTGDVLVFLPGERDIREAMEILAAESSAARDAEILPLMASLPAGEQQRVFRASARRKIILSTNVAETSLTIPGVKYVVDSGLARVARYIHRSGVERLQIEPVPRSSADQRAGRCGRTSPGVCIRLYGEDDYLRRPEHATPELMRTSLAGAVLSMVELGIRDIASFPFPTPPEPAMIRNAIAELRELEAVGEGEREGGLRLTGIGRRLARMPVEPRVGRMILAAGRERSAASVLPVAAFLSCEDPRRHSIDQRDAARQSYARFKAPDSDFAGILKLWQWWRKESEGLSQGKRRKLCKASFLSFNRMAEWTETWRQLSGVASRMGIDVADNGGGDAGMHRALLAGLLARIGKYHDGDRIYRGARGTSFAISPASVLRRSTPEWIVAAELVDTSRPLAATVAKIDGAWLEEIGGSLCRHAYRDPSWDAETGFVRALEDVTLFGLQIASGRRCDFGRVDHAMARDIFIRRGLVDGDVGSPPKPVAANNAAITRIRSAAAKLRRPEIFDEDALADHFDGAIPPEICSMPALARWLSGAGAAALRRFSIDADKWLPKDAPDDADFPDSINVGGCNFPLEYRDEGGAGDGITCVARRRNARLLLAWRSDWLVPGLLRDKLAWMISCLPSAQRRILSPVEETVARLMTYLCPGESPLFEAVSGAFREHWGLPVRPSAWDGVKVPANFSVRFVIADGSGRTIAEGRDLRAVMADAGIAAEGDSGERRPAGASGPALHSAWDMGDLPEQTLSVSSGWRICRHTALVDHGLGVEVSARDTAGEADSVSEDGVTRLLVAGLGPKAAARIRLRPFAFDTALYMKKIGYDDKSVAADVLFAAVKECAVAGRPRVLTAAEFERRRGLVGSGLAEALAPLSAIACETLSRAAAIARETEAGSSLPRSAAEGISAQLAWLVFPGFLRKIPLSRLRHYQRYFDAISVRIGRARQNPSADAGRQREIDGYWGRYRALVGDAEGLRMARRDALVEYRWMVEEMRVSLFAQELKTPVPVSAKRLDAKWREATGCGMA